MKFREVLDIMIEKDISDIFIRVNGKLKGRICSRVELIQDNLFGESEVEQMIKEIMDDEERKKLKARRGYEFTYWYKDNWRFRIGAFYQRNTPALVARKIDLRIPSFSELNLPAQILEGFCSQRRGMILLTGITGSGKSTTIASMIQYLNDNFGYHILTIEEPVEFTFGDNK